MSANTIRQQILIPLAVTLMVLLGFFLISVFTIKQKEVSEDFTQRYAALETLLQTVMTDRIELMETALCLVARDEALQAAMQERDRLGLLQTAAPLLDQVFARQGLTHFYFHTPERRVFLRVHKPDFYGDRIDRKTLERATEGRIGYGLELGPLGTFTLRVVMPWRLGSEVIGYIELGEEIDRFLSSMRENVRLEYFIAIDKTHLERDLWEQGMRMLGSTPQWDQFPGHVLIEGSLPEMPEGFHEVLAGMEREEAGRIFEVELEDSIYRGRFMPLLEAGEQQVGQMLVLLAVTEKVKTFNSSMAYGAVLTVLLGGALLLFSYLLLGRLSRQLVEAQNRLVSEFQRTRQAHDQLEIEMGERQRAQEELSQAHEQLEQRVEERTAELIAARDDLRRLIDNAHSLILTTDEQGRVQKWNLTAEMVTGIPREVIAGQDLISATLPQKTHGRARQMLARVLEGDSVTSFEFPLRNRRKEKLSLLLNATARRDARGRITGTIVVCQDITERKTAEENLRMALVEARQAGERVDAILRSLADGLIVVDASKQVVLANAPAEEFFGLSRGELIGQSLADAVKDSALLSQIEKGLGQEGAVFDLELATLSASHPLVIQARTSMLRGEVKGTILLLQDVTRQRTVDRLKNEFISTVAHEFRTPLSTILGFAELMLENEEFPREQKREFLTYIFDKADALSGIVDDLLDISRIESGRELELVREPVQAEDVFLPVIQHFRLQYEDRRFAADFSPAPEPLMLDRRKMAQVMENLLSNAVKYSPQGGDVWVGGQVEENIYRITVNDNGIGMSEEQVTNVFDKFYRADSSDVAVSGSGLGMSIVKHIVEGHGGKIAIESTPGQGTRVILRLPRGG